MTGLELGERRANLVERVGALDRDDEVAGRDRLGQFGQGRRARRGRAAFGLDAVLLDRGEVDDGVDAVPGDAELERKLDVAAPTRSMNAATGVSSAAAVIRSLTPSPYASGTAPRSRNHA